MRVMVVDGAIYSVERCGEDRKEAVKKRSEKSVERMFCCESGLFFPEKREKKRK